MKVRISAILVVLLFSLQLLQGAAQAMSDLLTGRKQVPEGVV